MLVCLIMPLTLSVLPAPACISEQDIIHFIGQRDVTVCINLSVLTDQFENYGFEVSKHALSDSTSLIVLTAGSWPCIVLNRRG